MYLYLYPTHTYKYIYAHPRAVLDHKTGPYFRRTRLRYETVVALLSYTLSSGHALTRNTLSSPVSSLSFLYSSPFAFITCACRFVVVLFHRRYSILLESHASVSPRPRCCLSPNTSIESIFQNKSMLEPNAARTRPAFPFPNYTALGTPSGGCEYTHPTSSNLTWTNQKPCVSQLRRTTPVFFAVTTISGIRHLGGSPRRPPALANFSRLCVSACSVPDIDVLSALEF